MATHPELKDAFNACVNNSLTEEEFEQNWRTMLEVHGEQENINLYEVYKHRACWVPAYFRHAFSPFLQTTARSEGFNAVLKRYISPQNSIFDFLRQYEALQSKILNAEKKAAAETALTDPDWWCPRGPFEVKMAKIYTRNIFFKFQWELRETQSYHCQRIGGSNNYELTVAGYPVPHYGDRNYLVFADPEKGIFFLVTAASTSVTAFCAATS